MRVLIVEDSERLRKSLAEGLRQAGYAVDTAEDGEVGLWNIQSTDYDVVILDIMLPKLDGLSLLTKARDEGKSPFVLILSARDTVEDRVAGLKKGADDYLVKPFSFDELLARVESLCRRRYLKQDPRIVLDNLEIDTARKVVRRAGQQLDLSRREYRVLEYLALKTGQVVSRTEIEAHIYDERVEPMSNVVDSAVSLLRKKVDLPGQEPLIHTRRGMGYVLELQAK